MSNTVWKMCCSILAVFVFTGQSYAVVYKWVDEQGQTHFSQMPPEQAEVEVIKTTPAPSVDTGKAQQEIDDLIKQQAKNDKIKQEQLKEQQLKAEQAKIKAENCTKAQQNLTTYQNNPGRRMTDAEGNVTRPSEEDRQETINKLKQSVSEFCS